MKKDLVACGGGSRWWRHTQALPHSLCQTGPEEHCQLAPALRRQENDDGVASSFNLPQVFVKCLAYAALRMESRDSGDKQRHASPAVMSLWLGAQLVFAKRRHWKHHFMPGLERYFIGWIHRGGKEERRDTKQGVGRGGRFCSSAWRQ